MWEQKEYEGNCFPCSFFIWQVGNIIQNSSPTGIVYNNFPDNWFLLFTGENSDPVVTVFWERRKPCERWNRKGKIQW